MLELPSDRPATAGSLFCHTVATLQRKLNTALLKNQTFLMFVGIIVFCTALLWPQLSSLQTIHTKSTFSPTVAIFNSWTVGWNADRLGHWLNGYWRAPIFAPETSAFAFSEPQPATMLVAPVVWVSGSELWAYKVWLWVSLIGNGIATVLLCRQLKFHWLCQSTAAAAMILLPVAQQRIDVIQLVPIWSILWFFRCVLVLHSGPVLHSGTAQNYKATGWKAVECGISFAVCFWICVHHALFLSLLMPFCSLAFWAKRGQRQFVSQAGIALAVAACLIAPVALPIATAMQEHQFERGRELVGRQAAKPIHYFSSQENAWINPLATDASSARRLCVGWIRMIAAACGIVLALRCCESRVWATFFALMAAFAFCFSLGPNLQLWDWSPWNFVANYVPGFRQVRNTFRFAWFVQIALVLFACKAFDQLAKSVLAEQYDRPVSGGVRQKYGPVFKRFGLVCVAVLLAVEVWPTPTVAHAYPNAAANEDWTEFIRTNHEPGSNIVCLPLPASSKLKDYRSESTWMIHGLAHGAEMRNGYSGFFPSRYLKMLSLYRDEGISQSFLSDLADANTTLIVVKRQSEDARILSELTSSTDTASDAGFGVQLVFSSKADIDVYHLSWSQR